MSVRQITYSDGRFRCPYCDGRDTHEHSQTWWCMTCGWAQTKHTALTTTYSRLTIANRDFQQRGPNNE